jgi:regulator of replication initiation timing
MRTFHRNTRRGWMIFNEADKGASGGSAAPSGDDNKPAEGTDPSPAPAPAPAPVDPTPPATQASATAAAKPTVFQKAAAMLKDKSELLGTISTHEATIASLTSQLSTANSQLSATMAELATLKAGSAELEAALTKATAANTTVAQSTIDQVAALGFDANALPAATSASEDAETPTSVADFNAKLNAFDDKDARAKFYAKHAKKLGL